MAVDKIIADPPVSASPADKDAPENEEKGKPDLRIITTSDDDSRIDEKTKPMSPTELFKRAFSPESIREALSPALDVAKKVMPKVEPISCRNFLGLSIKVAFP
jgi:hypothetical protein